MNVAAKNYKQWKEVSGSEYADPRTMLLMQGFTQLTAFILLWRLH